MFALIDNVSSVFGKGNNNIVDWINRGLATYINKEKAQSYLYYPALSAAPPKSNELNSATDIVRNFENPSVSEENSSSPTKTTAGRSTFAERREMAAAVEEKPKKLYGNKVIKKMKKHGFTLDELKDLPAAVADPIAVFNNYQKDGNRSILTEMRTANGNFLVTVDLGKGEKDIDFNVVSSVLKIKSLTYPR